MTDKEKQNTKKLSKTYLYNGECIRCKKITESLDKNNDLCFGCRQTDLEFEERRNAPPYDINDKEAAFNHEKSQQGWDDDMDEEIQNEHFR